MGDDQPRTALDAQQLAHMASLLVDKVPGMLAYWDADLRCRFANRAYQTWFGVAPETMLGMRLEDLLGPLFALNHPYIEGVLRGEEQEFEREIPDPAGGAPRHSLAHYIPDLVDGVVRGFYVFVSDITRPKRAEAALLTVERQLKDSERRAATATLAAGVAHEINNPLAAVLANLELAIDLVDKGRVAPELLKEALVDARDASKRIRDIVRNMGRLARGDALARECVDINDTLDQCLALANNAVQYRAKVVRSLGRECYIYGNSALLVQLFVNLLINAAQSFREEELARNEIRVSTWRDDGHVVIEVADNGCGIADELQSFIFDPYFTTKSVGEGTGLGLSISAEIVHTLAGEISVKSKLGQGSVFRVVFPAFTGQTTSAAPQPRALPASAPAPATRQRMLVVDDDPLVAKSMARILGATHDVVVTNRADAAITLLLDDKAGFDVVFCDLMMPQMSGQDLYETVTKARPALARRFVFMTGGAFQARGQSFLAAVSAPIIEKPFELEQLQAVLEAMRKLD